MTKRICLSVALTVLMLISQNVWAIKNCPACGYRLNTNDFECTKCLRLIEWPFQPPRDRKAKVVIRTGTDAFIRDQHSTSRSFRHDRNAGGDLYGPIGSWGGATTLRYLLRFDVAEAFALAGASLKDFELRRATLRIKVADKGNNKGALPIRIYALTRYFQEGSDEPGTRKKNIDGCTWVYAAPHMVWHREGGDYNENLSCRGILPEAGTVDIDVTEIFRERFTKLTEDGVWEDPGMIIMRDPHAFGDFGYINIFSFESRTAHGQVRAPELFIE